MIRLLSNLADLGQVCPVLHGQRAGCQLWPRAGRCQPVAGAAGGGLLTAGEIIQAPDTLVKWDNMPPELLAGDNSPLERSYNPPILR